MKKLSALALALIMALSLAACSDKAAPDASQTTDPGASRQEQSNFPDSDSGIGDTGTWPSNQYTDLIPKPKGGTVFSDSDVDNPYFKGHTIIMTDWSLEDCKAYAEEVISAGFTQPGNGFDSVVVSDNDEIYSFGGVNEDGVYVTFGTTAMGTGNISIQVKNEG